MARWVTNMTNKPPRTNPPESNQAGRLDLSSRHSDFLKHSRRIIGLTLLVSLAAHITAIIGLERFAGFSPTQHARISPEKDQTSRVRIQVKPSPTQKPSRVREPQDQKPSQTPDLPQAETPMAETQAPEQPSFLGQQNRKTDKQTRLDTRKFASDNTANAGPGKKRDTPAQKPVASAKAQDSSPKPPVKPTTVAQAQPKPPSVTKPAQVKKPQASAKPGKKRPAKTKQKTPTILTQSGPPEGFLVKPQNKTQPSQPETDLTSSGEDASDTADARRDYLALLPDATASLGEIPDGGYIEPIDESIEIGDAIDLNTTEYRYIGYFTGLRKAIGLVWTYPAQAKRKALQGKVNLQFAINRKGYASRIKVLRSSGYEVLDRAVIEAVRLASPFSPLPPAIGKEPLVITGSFRYVIGG